MDVKGIFEKTGGLLEGHFLLTSGAHSPFFLQCARVFQYPDYTRMLCGELAGKLARFKPQTVVGPATGGIIVAYEVAAALGTRGIFAEKKDDELILGRGFGLEKGERVVVVEDVTTTGGSVKKVIELVEKRGADVAAVGIIVDRSGGKITYSVPSVNLLTLSFETYPSDACPLCKEGLPLVEPDTGEIIG